MPKKLAKGIIKEPIIKITKTFKVSLLLKNKEIKNIAIKQR